MVEIESTVISVVGNGEETAALTRSLSSVLSGTLLIVIARGDCVDGVGRAFRCVQPVKRFREVKSHLTLSHSIVRSYLGSGEENVGLLVVENEEDLQEVLHTLSGVYTYILVFSSPPQSTTAPCPEVRQETASDFQELKSHIFSNLSSTSEIKRLIEGGEISEEKREVLEEKIRDAAIGLLDRRGSVPPEVRRRIIHEVTDEALGLGPLEELRADPKVTEIMVNAFDNIYVEKEGKIRKTDARFANSKSLRTVIDRIVAPLGRRVDEASPQVDARLADGSRVHIIIPPLSLKGPALTIRKFREDLFSMEDLVALGSLSTGMADFFKTVVRKKANILISGGTGSGKTTLLNCLSSLILPEERIITIEDAAELKLNQPHVVRLEARPPNIEGRGEITIRDLVRASLRMRPDRIIIGECRGAESLDMLQAMNTGHEGSLTTIHANTCRDCLARLTTLVLFAGFDLPVKAIREQIASAIDLVIQVRRERDGVRRIAQVSEITGLEGETMTMQDLFIFQRGECVPTGFRPKFLEDRL